MNSRRFGRILLVILVFGILLALFLIVPRFGQAIWSFDREVSETEKTLRTQVVECAEQWLGCNEKDGSHKEIIDLYNSHPPLARGYAVTYDDEWCSTYVSAVAIQTELTHLIPTECGCEPQIELFEAIDAWVEADDYIPLPGDVIYYHWNCFAFDDCTDWADHVGIVVGTWNGWIKVIEGNRREDVSYRYIRINDRQIRGYGTPNYG